MPHGLTMITFPDISFLEADLRIDTVYPPPPSAALTDVVITGRVINFGRNALTSFPWHTASMTVTWSMRPSSERSTRVTR